MISPGGKDHKAFGRADPPVRNPWPLLLIAVPILFWGVMTCFAVSESRQKTVNRELVELMERQLEAIAGNASREDLAELAAAVESLGTGEEKNTIRMNRRIFELAESLESRLDDLEQSILTRREPSERLADEYAELGRLNRDSGNYDEAVGHYRESLEYQKSPEVLYAYAESLYRSDPDVRDDQEIIRSLQTVLAHDPLGSDALNLLGAVYLETGDITGAIESYAVLAELNPGDPEINHIYGRLLLNRRRYEDAVAPLSLASRALPEKPAVWSDLGWAYGALGRHFEAAGAYESALAAEFDYPPALLGLAESRIALGRGGDAVNSAAAYTAIRGNDYRGYLILGDAHALSGEALRAERAWKKALNVLTLNSPEDVRRWTEASIRLVGSFLGRENYRGALESATGALEYVEDGDLLESASRAARELGDIDAAEGYAKRLGRLSWANGDAW